MKVPISWLKDFVDITLPIEELTKRLTLAGLEEASIDYIGVEGADLVWDRDRFVIARVLAVKQHPNADRLVLAEVDHGAEEPEILVTTQEQEIWMTWGGIMAIAEGEHIQLARNNRTSLGYMTCMVMLGRGVRTFTTKPSM